MRSEKTGLHRAGATAVCEGGTGGYAGGASAGSPGAAMR